MSDVAVRENQGEARRPQSGRDVPSGAAFAPLLNIFAQPIVAPSGSAATGNSTGQPATSRSRARSEQHGGVTGQGSSAGPQDWRASTDVAKLNAAELRTASPSKQIESQDGPSPESTVEQRNRNSVNPREQQGASSGRPREAVESAEQKAANTPARVVNANSQQQTNAVQGDALRMPGTAHQSAQSARAVASRATAISASTVAARGTSLAPRSDQAISLGRGKQLHAEPRRLGTVQVPVREPRQVPELAGALVAALRRGTGTATLRLNTEHLGVLQARIEVRSSGDERTIAATLQPATEAARQLLESSRDELKAALEARGLKVDRIDIDASGVVSRDGASGNAGEGGRGTSSEGQHGSGASSASARGSEGDEVVVSEADLQREVWTELGLDAVA